MLFEPITITNVLQKRSRDVAGYINTSVLNNKIPSYTANSPLSIQTDLIPLLGLYANLKSYVTELYNIVYSEYCEQKSNKKNKKNEFNDDYYVDLEAKKEILHRSIYALDRLYEAASRLMTGIGEPDPRMNRHV